MQTWDDNDDKIDANGRRQRRDSKDGSVERTKKKTFAYLTARSLLNVLQTNVEALGDEAVSDLLVDDNTDGAGGDVPHAAGASVVELVRHAWADALAMEEIATKRAIVPLWMAPLATMSTGSPSLNDLM